MNMIRIITSSTPLLHQLSGITLLIASSKKNCRRGWNIHFTRSANHKKTTEAIGAIQN